MVALRLTFSAIILLAFCRPKLRGYSRADWVTVILFSIALTGMNVLFYQALARLPLGATVTIEFLGPLLLSVIISRKSIGWVWAVLAFIGVALLGRGGFTDLDILGIAFACGAGAMWAGYILMSTRTGQRFPKIDGLAIAMTIGAILTLPFGVAATGPVIVQPQVLLLGAVIALLSSVVPYGLELFALRRIPPAAFSILMSFAPAIAAGVGLIILKQELGIVEIIAIALVVGASIGAVRTAVLSNKRSTQMVPDPIG
jgi:inner membrane transporter RhtA